MSYTPPSTAPVTLPEACRIKVTGPTTACAWVLAMVQNGIDFHPDTPPADMIVIATGEAFFRDEDHAFLERQIDALFDHIADPYALFIECYAATPGHPNHDAFAHTADEAEAEAHTQAEEC